MPVVRIAPLRDVIVLLANDGQAVEISRAGQGFDVGNMQRGKCGRQFDDHAPGRAIPRIRCFQGPAGASPTGWRQPEPPACSAVWRPAPACDKIISAQGIKNLKLRFMYPVLHKTLTGCLGGEMRRILLCCLVLLMAELHGDA